MWCYPFFKWPREASDPIHKWHIGFYPLIAMRGLKWLITDHLWWWFDCTSIFCTANSLDTTSCMTLRTIFLPLVKLEWLKSRMEIINHTGKPFSSHQIRQIKKCNIVNLTCTSCILPCSCYNHSLVHWHHNSHLSPNHLLLYFVGTSKTATF